LNLALGALAAALMVAILAVLLVDDGQSEREAPAVLVTAVPVTAAEPVTLPPDSTSTPFQALGELTGRWQSSSGDTFVQFDGTTIEALRCAIEIDDRSANLVLAEPSRLSAQPSVNQPVQAVIFVGIETGTVRTAPTSVLVEFLITDDGLLMEVMIDGSVREYVLLPI
jgi:hypothetical protein